jgi:hypothetical protein
MAKLKTIQLIRVPGHMGIDVNEIPEQLAKQDSLLSLTGPELGLCIPNKVSWEVTMGTMSRKRERYWLPILNKGKLRAFLQDTAERAGELLNFSRNQL